MIEFQEGPPLYMQETKLSLSVKEARFTIESLQSLYKQIRSLQEDSVLIDAETFNSILTLNL